MLCTELDTKGLYQKAVPYTHPACPDNRIHRKERCDPGYVSRRAECAFGNEACSIRRRSKHGVWLAVRIKGSAQKIDRSESNAPCSSGAMIPRRISQTGGVDVLSLAANSADDMDERVETMY